MTNPYRGEVMLHIGGRPRKMRLTLGALAELEQALGEKDLLALAERFEEGRLSASDAIKALAAGLRGAGESVTDEEVRAMEIEGGPPAALRAVAQMLAAAFGAAPS